jgi:hypothetical protein
MIIFYNTTLKDANEKPEDIEDEWEEKSNEMTVVNKVKNFKRILENASEKNETEKENINNSQKKAYIDKNNPYFSHLLSGTDSIVNDKRIDLEFENYLNEENDLDNLICESENCEKFQAELNLKMKKLETLDFNSIDDLRQIAIEKYGFVNKKFRRKAWPILIANREIYLNDTPTKYNNMNSNNNNSNNIDNNKLNNDYKQKEQTSKFNQISKLYLTII